MNKGREVGGYLSDIIGSIDIASADPEVAILIESYELRESAPKVTAVSPKDASEFYEPKKLFKVTWKDDSEDPTMVSAFVDGDEGKVVRIACNRGEIDAEGRVEGLKRYLKRKEEELLNFRRRMKAMDIEMKELKKEVLASRGKISALQKESEQGIEEEAPEDVVQLKKELLVEWSRDIEKIVERMRWIEADRRALLNLLDDIDDEREMDNEERDIRRDIYEDRLDRITFVLKGLKRLRRKIGSQVEDKNTFHALGKTPNGAQDTEET